MPCTIAPKADASFPSRRDEASAFGGYLNQCERFVLMHGNAEADQGVVRAVRSNPLNSNENIFIILFLVKKDLLNNNNN